jgi:hypothetical protein
MTLRPIGAMGVLLTAVLILAGAGLLPAVAHAAPPQVGAVWTTEVAAASATFHGEVDPEGTTTTCRFEYVTDAHFKAEGFAGAAIAGCESGAGSGVGFVTVSRHVSALKAATTYHYRLGATGEDTATGSPQTFTTEEIGGPFKLPDARGWELVSPAEKNGGAILGPEANHAGGVFEAAAGGEAAITYSSASSFGGGEAQGAPQVSQYISRRSAAGWSTQNITTPTLSGAYGNDPNGAPYQLFSPDLSAAILLNGVHCRGEGTGCPVANPPLPGSDAPAGYQNYYLRNEAGGFSALLTSADAELGLSAEEFDLAFAAASPDLQHIVLSTCAALTAGATEAPGIEGCDPGAPNLYEWSGGGLTLINSSPGAALAAQGGAISADGSRVYFTEAGELWLREAGALHQVDQAEGGGGSFQTATPDGALAFFTIQEAPGEAHLYRYSTATHGAESIATAVEGVLGASADGQVVFYQDAGGLREWRQGTITTIATGGEAALAGDYPPTTGTARVSADGSRLLFLSKAPLTGYDNTDVATGQPDSEVFLWSAAAGLVCLSCNPTGERPAGPSTIPGAYANGNAAAAAAGEIVTDSYKPRNLSASANRVFFDSRDSLVPLDTNKAADVYQWEGQGTGSCAKPGGCLNLISSGTDSEGARFVDAGESGEDAYFLTSSSLVPGDPGSRDLYDARVGGGFPVPGSPIPCEGDACQPLPSPPEDPTVGSLLPAPGNPPVHFPKVHHKKKNHHKKKHSKKQGAGKKHQQHQQGKDGRR